MSYTAFLCHACGWLQSEEQPDLTCANCGAARDQIERLELIEDTTEEKP